MIKCKKMISCALATMIAMQGGGLVFAGEKEISYSTSQLQEANYSSLLNYMLDNGYLTTDKDNNLLVTAKYKAYVENKLKATNENLDVYVDKNIIGLRSKANEDIGETKFVWTWKGFDIYLDHRICTAIVNGGDATAIISEAVAMIVPETALVTGTISCILHFSSFVFKQQDLGRGVIIAVLYEQGIVGPIPHWISSQ